jgi:hypothetical protein
LSSSRLAAELQHSEKYDDRPESYSSACRKKLGFIAHGILGKILDIALYFHVYNQAKSTITINYSIDIK